MALLSRIYIAWFKAFVVHVIHVRPISEEEAHHVHAAALGSNSQKPVARVDYRAVESVEVGSFNQGRVGFAVHVAAAFDPRPDLSQIRAL